MSFDEIEIMTPMPTSAAVVRVAQVCRAQAEPRTPGGVDFAGDIRRLNFIRLQQQRFRLTASRKASAKRGMDACGWLSNGYINCPLNHPRLRNMPLWLIP
jgi:hypothetical protein